MNKKVFGIFAILFLLIGVLGMVSAKNFIIENSSNPSQTYFVVNGTTGNVQVSNNISAQYFKGSGKYLTDINSSAVNSSQLNYWLKNGNDLYYNNGNVGIGTNNPKAPLHIISSLGYPSTSGSSQPNAGFRIQGTSNNGVLDLGVYGTHGGWIQSTNQGNLSTNYPLLLNPNGGNVGIGTTNPGSPLVVKGSSAGAIIESLSSSGNPIAFTYQDSSGNGIFYLRNSSNSNVVQIHSHGSSYFNGGNVGIGTTSPLTKLDIQGSSPSILIGDDRNINTANASAVWLGENANSYVRGGGLVYNGATNQISIATSNNGASQSNAFGGVNRLTINEDNGYVGIGTTSPSTALDVNGTVTATQFVGNGSGLYGLNASNSNTLGGYPASFFAPLNKTMIGNFNFTGQQDFNGGWTNNGLSIIGGSIYAQQGYFYKINSLQVSTLTVNGSIIPPSGFDNQFDIGNSSLRWRNLYLGSNAYIGGEVGIGTTSPSRPLEVDTSGAVAALFNSSQSGNNYSLVDIHNSNSNGYLRLGLFNGGVAGLAPSTSTSPTLSLVGNNVGIGTTNPLHLLSLSSATTSAQVSIQGSSNTLYLGGDWGIGYTSASNLIFKTNNSERLGIDSSGNVGIGTTSPGAKLDVNGSINANNILVNGTQLTAGSIGGVNGSGSANYIPKFTGSNTLGNSVIYQSGSDVGIGTTSPNRNLVVYSSTSDAYLKLYSGANASNYDSGILFNNPNSGDGQITIRVPSNSKDLQFWTGGADNLVLTNSGNVGIGTTNPSTLLDLQASSPVLRFGSTSLGAAATSSIQGYGSSGTRYWILGDRSGSSNDTGLTSDVGNLYFSAGQTSAQVTLDTNGNIGIGTNSPSANLEVYGSGTNVSQKLTSQNSNGNPTLTKLDIGSNVFNVNENNIYAYRFQVSGGSPSNYNLYLNGLKRVSNAESPVNLLTVLGNGNVGIGTTSPGAKLDVNGNLRLNNSESLSTLTFGGGYKYGLGVEGSYTSLFYNSAGNGIKLGSYNGTTFSPQLTIDNSGNVGIGTTTPQNALNVIGDINATGTIYGTVSGNINPGFTTGSVIYQGSSGLAQDNANFYYDSTNHRLGIGTTSPSQTLDVAGRVQVRAQGDNTVALGVKGSSQSNDILELLQSSTGGTNSGTIKLYSGNPAVLETVLRGAGDSYFGGKVGIGTSSPSYNLEVNGSARFYEQGQTGQGTVAVFARDTTSDAINLQITPGGTTNTIWYGQRWGNNIFWEHGSSTGTVKQMELNTNGALTLFNYTGSSNDSNIYLNPNGNTYLNGGNVGIGTTNPSQKLEVNGYGLFDSGAYIGNTNTRLTQSSGNSLEITTNSGYIQIGPQNTAWAHIDTDRPDFYFNKGLTTAGTDYSLSSYSSDNLYLATGGTKRLTILSSNGNVGIGITSPSYKLDVAGTVNAYNYLVNGTAITPGANVSGTGTTNYIPKFTSSSNIGNSAIYQNGNNIGIGTTSASYPLDVQGSTTQIRFSTTSSEGGYLKYDSSTNNGDFYIGAGGETPTFQISYANADTKPEFTFITDNGTVQTNAVTILRGGNVGIGTTTPDAKLDVNGQVLVGNGDRTQQSTFPLYISDSSNLGWKVANSSGSSRFELYAGYGGVNEVRLLNGESLVGYGQNLVLNTSSSHNTIIQPNGGNVGIGTTNPHQKLEVDGNLNVTGTIYSSGTVSYSGLTANRIVATDSSKNLVSTISAANLRSSVSGVTGSAGNLVFSSSPTISTPTLSGGTTNINVGRGNVYLEDNSYDNADGAGVTLRTSNNPTDASSIFAVRSSGEAARLWVGQDFTTTGYNDFYVGSSSSTVANDTTLYSIKLARSGDSYFNGGNVGIGLTSPGEKLDVSGSIRASSQLISTVATGTAPLAVSSTTEVTNLNANYLQGHPASYFATATSAGVSSVSNSDGSLTISPTTGAVVASLNVGHANTWSASQTYTGGIIINQNNVNTSTTGNLVLEHPASGGASSIIFPSTVNHGSDYGFITYFDDNNNYDYWGNGAENSALVIGTQNDPANSNSDVVVLNGVAANIFTTSGYNLFKSGNVGIGSVSSPANLLDISTTGTTSGIDFNGGEALTGTTSDGWLRLNQGGSFSNGVYTPHNLRVDGSLYISSSAHFYSDASGRIATPNNFYVQSSSADTYLYSTNTYLGSTSGDHIYLRGNEFTWSGGSGGIITSGGDVGIGTSTPPTLLSVGSVGTDTQMTGNVARFAGPIIFDKTTTSSETDLPAISEGSVLNAGLGNDLLLGATSSDGGIVFYTGNTGTGGAFGVSSNKARMSILSNGNVGIGTTSPTSTLSVGGTGISGAAVYGYGTYGLYGHGTYGAYGNGGTYGVYGTGPYGVYGSGSSYGVYSNGNIYATGTAQFGKTGIGFAPDPLNDGTELFVRGQTAANILELQNKTSYAWKFGTVGVGLFQISSSANSNHDFVINAYNGNIGMGGVTNPTSNLSVGGSGNSYSTIYGTASGVSNGYGVYGVGGDSYSGISNQVAAGIYGSSGTFYTGVAAGVYGNGTTTGATGVYGSAGQYGAGVYGKSGTSGYGVYSSGDMYTTGCLYYNGAGSPLGTCASDARLKTNVTTLAFDNPLAQINGLRPINYNYNKLFKNGTDKALHQGLIAQQVLKVAPELVTTNNKTGYYEVKYGDLPWLTLEGLQQLSNETNQINSTLTGLSVQQISLQATVKEQKKTISSQNKTIVSLNETVTKLSSTLNKICSNNPKLCE